MIIRYCIFPLDLFELLSNQAELADESLVEGY